MPKIFNDATKQEAFNATFIGLRDQGFHRSLADGTTTFCAYRGAEGRKCAIGFLIPDESYSDVIEGRGGGSREVIKMTGFEYSGEIVNFFTRLQCAHDDFEAPEVIEDALRKFAVVHKLTVPA